MDIRFVHTARNINIGTLAPINSKLMKIQIINTATYDSLQAATKVGGAYGADIEDTLSQTFLHGTAKDILLTTAAGMRCLDGNFSAQFILQSDTYEILDVANFEDGELQPRFSVQEEQFIEAFGELNPKISAADISLMLTCYRNGFDVRSGIHPDTINGFAASYQLWEVAQLLAKKAVDFKHEPHIESHASTELSSDGARVASIKYGWSQEVLGHALNNVTSEYGNETVIPLANGRAIHCPSYPLPCDNFRVTQDGYELGYWSSDEFKDDPEDVLGAVLGLAHGSPRATTVEHHHHNG